MTKNDFIERLFDSGNGLSLKNINDINNTIHRDIPADLVEDIRNENPEWNRIEVENFAMQLGYDNFINQMHDCTDMLELKSFLVDYIHQTDIADMAIYNLFHHSWIYTIDE